MNSHRYERRLNLVDTDAAGVVFFSQVLTLCHEAYEVCLTRSEVNLPELVTHGVILPIVATECQYKQPMKWGETITFKLSSQLLGDSKFAVNYHLTNSQDQLTAIAKTVHICLQRSTKQRLPLPQTLQQWLISAGQSN